MRMKKDKRCAKKGGNSKLMLIGISIILLISLVVLVKALTDDERTNLENELNNLTSSLSDSGYNWLVNYNVSYPYVSVFREGGSEEIARFTNITGDGFSKYQIFLTNLGENESYSTFDLRSFGDVEYDYVVDPVAYGIPKGMNLLNNSYGTFAGISGRVRLVAIPHDVYLMKIRIDNIRKELNDYEVKNG